MKQPCEEGQCELCSMRAAVLFAGVEQEVLRRIQHDIEERRVPRGATLYRMEEPGRAIFTVRQGLVKLLQYLPDGGERIVRLVRATDVTGLEALVGQPYQHDAVVEQEAVVCRIPLDVIQRMEGESPQLYRELMRRWQQALSEADAWLTELGTGSEWLVSCCVFRMRTVTACVPCSVAATWGRCWASPLNRPVAWSPSSNARKCCATMAAASVAIARRSKISPASSGSGVA